MNDRDYRSRCVSNHVELPIVSLRSSKKMEEFLFIEGDAGCTFRTWLPRARRWMRYVNSRSSHIWWYEM